MVVEHELLLTSWRQMVPWSLYLNCWTRLKAARMEMAYLLILIWVREGLKCVLGSQKCISMGKLNVNARVYSSMYAKTIVAIPLVL